MWLITGATGTLGGAVLRALPRGQPVRLLTRDPARLPGGVVADLDDPSSLPPVLEGVSAAFLVTRPSPRMAAQEAAFRAAARAAGVARVVRVSAHGAGVQARSALNRWHGEQEALWSVAGIPTLSLRPQFLMSNLAPMLPRLRVDERLRLPMGDLRLAMISPDDVGRVAVAALGGAGGTGGVELTGPEALHGEDVAVILEHALGRPVTYAPVTRDDTVAALLRAGRPDWQARGLADLYADFSDGSRTGAVEALTGQPPETLADWLARKGACLSPD